jgi:mRNA interferase RelE/StbE
MARYELRFKPSVAKDVRGIPRTEGRRVLARIESLRDDPRPPGCEKLSAHERYRLRQGSYRILYSVSDADVAIEIVRVAHRREVYRER